MRAYVFTDKALTRQAGRFVWLAIDTEKAANAPFRTKYTVEAWPSFFIVDPATETPVLRWMGGATVPQLQKILDDGARTYAGKGGALDEELARADKLYGGAKNAEAAKAYRDVLAHAPAKWPDYGRATESLLFSLQRVHDDEGCAKTARDAYPKLKGTPSSANVAASGLGCALSLPPTHPERAALVAEMIRASNEVLADKKTKIAADDRSAVYETLVGERDGAKDEAGKKKIAGEWAKFLEGEAARAKTADSRAVFDPHRLGAYIEMGAPERAVPMLQASERDLPDDYNPPARLAIAYKEMKKWDDALAASDRALAKVYGPRSLTVLRTRGQIYAGKGDAAAAKKTVVDALRLAEGLPPGQRSDSTIASLRKILESMP